jgi:hypothetical protein
MSMSAQMLQSWPPAHHRPAAAIASSQTLSSPSPQIVASKRVGLALEAVGAVMPQEALKVLALFGHDVVL